MLYFWHSRPAQNNFEVEKDVENILRYLKYKNVVKKFSQQYIAKSQVYWKEEIVLH